MTPEQSAALGPLAALAGIWEGAEGQDVAPSDDRGIERNAYRERLVLEPMDPVQNHEQVLGALRYATTAWRLGEDKPFHEEVGYWLYDAAAKQAMRCFSVPRGVTLIAGGTVQPGARAFELTADVDHRTFGILSNPFLTREFETVRYELRLVLEAEDGFRYEEDTVLRMKDRSELFHHTDANKLKRVQRF